MFPKPIAGTSSHERRLHFVGLRRSAVDLRRGGLLLDAGMTPISSLIAVAVISISAATGAGVAWQWQAGRVHTAQTGLLNEQLDRAKERLAIQLASRDALVSAAGQVTQAQAQAASRIAAADRDRDRAVTELDRLRIASADAVRAASASTTACTAAVGTYAQLLDACSSELVRVADEADRWSNQALMYQDAWPKGTP